MVKYIDMFYENKYEKNTKEWFMYEAYKEALKAYEKEECPVGAIIVRNNEIISKAHNIKEKQQNALAHAEVIAINRASQKLNTWRLTDCDMYVTLEPCAMCAGAIIQARLNNVHIGTTDPKAGAVVSVIQLLDVNEFNHKVKYSVGILQELCSDILKHFFKQLRLKKNT